MLYPGNSFIAATPESTNGTFVQPAASDILVVENLDYTLLDLEKTEYKPLLPFFDAGASYTASALGKVAFDVALVGSNSLANLPPWSPLFTACGLLKMARVNTAIHPSSLTCDATGTVATATAANHGLKNGQFVYITGAAGGGAFYNASTGTYIRNVSTNTFDYVVVGGAAGSYGLPATVNITADNQWLLRTRKRDSSGNALKTTLSFAFYLDGVMHCLAGAIGSVTISGKAKDIPRARFEFVGLPLGNNYIQMGQSLAGDFSQYLSLPVELSVPGNVGCTMFNLSAPTVYEFSLNLGNAMTHTVPMTGSEALDITDRSSSGSITIETPDDSSYPILIQSVRTSQRGLLTLWHGSSPNRFTVRCRAAELGNPRYGNRDGRSTLQLDLKPRPVDGDDGITFLLS